jgi:Fur family transcriptional regulator, iron response regulator
MSFAATADARPFAEPLERLKRVGLRPTRQRLALARLLFSRGDRHLSAEQLHAEAKAARVAVSLATVYNTLNQFTRAGLLREVVVEAGRSYFDTNTSDHHHVLALTSGDLIDIPPGTLSVSGLPPVPEGLEVERVDVVVRLRKKA